MRKLGTRELAEYVDRKSKKAFLRIRDNFSNIEEKQGIQDKNIEEIHVSLRSELHEQKIDVAKEILRQSSSVRRELFEKERLLYEELKEEVFEKIRVDLARNIKAQVIDELNLHFVDVDEYALKVREILQKLKEFKTYVHDYTASQVGIVQQQIEMLKKVLNGENATTESQDKIFSILNSLTQKIEELDAKVSQVDTLEGVDNSRRVLSRGVKDDSRDVSKESLGQVESRLRQIESGIQVVEKAVSENSEKIDILDSFLVSEVEEKLITNVEELKENFRRVKEEIKESKDVNRRVLSERSSREESVGRAEIENIVETVNELSQTLKTLESEKSSKAEVEEINTTILDIERELETIIQEVEQLNNSSNVHRLNNANEESYKEQNKKGKFATKDEMLDVEKSLEEVKETLIVHNKEIDILDKDLSELDDKKADKGDIHLVDDKVQSLQKVVENLEIPDINSIDMSDFVSRNELEELDKNISLLDADKANREELEELDRNILSLETDKANREELKELDKSISLINSNKLDREEFEDVKRLEKEIRDEIKGTQDDIKSTQNDVRDSQYEIESAKENIKDVQDEMKRLSADIGTLDNNLSGLDSRKADKEDCVEPAMISELVSQIEHIKEDVLAHHNQITELSKEDLQEEIKHLEEKLDKEIEDLEQKVKEARTLEKIEKCNEEIGSLKENASMLKDTLNTVEKSVKETVTKVEFEKVKAELEGEDLKKLNKDEFDAHVQFSTQVQKIYEGSYVILFQRFYASHRLCESKRKYVVLLRKTQEEVLKYVKDESAKLEKKYDIKKIQVFKRELSKSIVRDCLYLRQSWKESSVVKGKEESRKVAKEIEKKIKRERDESAGNFFTWFVFNRK